MMTMKIYFAGSIRGGRSDAGLYREIIAHLQKHGEVLTEHIGLDDLTQSGEEGLTDGEIYGRDLEWLRQSDVVVSEVTNPSLGVGFEIATAIGLNKRVLCLFRKQPGRRLSAMIAGCPDVACADYSSQEELHEMIDDFFHTGRL